MKASRKAKRLPPPRSFRRVPAHGHQHGGRRRANRRSAGNVLKIADNYDDEVDNAVAAMTSLLEPIMIVFLAVVVGSIVIAMFRAHETPLIDLMNSVGDKEFVSNYPALG
jgi:hypothetical protein